jgi:serine/threonine-protein kinase HipA
LDLDLALEVVEYFRIEAARAKKILSDVKRAVCNWRIIANKYGISKSEQDMKSIAFQEAEA